MESNLISKTNQNNFRIFCLPFELLALSLEYLTLEELIPFDSALAQHPAAYEILLHALRSVRNTDKIGFLTAVLDSDLISWVMARDLCATFVNLRALFSTFHRDILTDQLLRFTSETCVLFGLLEED
jgi:hypothetical protein